MSVDNPYAGRLAAFGHPHLDAMYQRSKEKATRIVRVKEPIPERCPSCGEVRILTRTIKAVLCAECHAGIDACVARGGLWE